MATSRVIIIGAGGHAQVIAEALWLMRQGGADVIPTGYLDDDPALAGREFVQLPVLGVVGALADHPHDAVVIAIGHNPTRRRIYEMLAGQNEAFYTVQHPHCSVSPSARLGVGSMACSGVVVVTGAVVGDNTIINTGCTVDHHNTIGAHAHIAPGAHLGGNVTIGEGALIGIGSVVMPGRSVGDWAVVGAGACVTKDVPSGQTVLGIPARSIQG